MILWNMKKINYKTDLFWNILTVLVRNLLQFLFLHVSTLVISIVLAGAGDGGPDLVIPGALPLVLTILLVLSLALCFRVVLHLVPDNEG